MPLTDNLVSYWKLDETSGTREDSHGNNDLTDYNTVDYDTGKINNAAKFIATNSEYLAISDALQSGLDPTGSFSISMWVKCGTANDDRRHYIARDKSGSRCLVVFTDNSQQMMFFVNDTSGCLQTNPMTSGNWYHFVFVYTYIGNGTSLMDMYANGSSCATQITNAVGPMTDSTGEFSVGRREYSGYEDYCNDLMDEVGYWARALTSTDVTALYNSGNGLAYPLSEGGNQLNINPADVPRVTVW